MTSRKHETAALVLMAGTLALAALAWGAASAAEPAGDPKALELSRMIDDLYRSASSRGKVTMIVTTPHYSRTLEMEVWSRGTEDTLIRITSPRKEKGTATLKKGNEMWNYLPKIRKTIRVPPSMMMGSWMGSDFTNDDLVKESRLEEDYFVEFLADAPAGTIGLDFRPRPAAPVTWSRVVALIDAESSLPKSMDYYDEKGRKVRVLEYSDIRDLGGRTIPVRLTLTPLTEDKQGNSTVIVYDEMEFDIALGPTMFSLTSLRRDR